MRFKARLQARLTDAAYAALAAIPGVEPWHSDRWRVSWPPSAHAAVLETVKDFGLTFSALTEGTSPAKTLPPEPAFLREGIEDYAKPFQRKIARFLAEHGRFLLQSEPGSGKTLISHLWACYLHARKLLIVTPTSVVLQQADRAAEYTTRAVLAWKAPSTRRKADPVPETWWSTHGDTPCVVIVGWESLLDNWELFASWGFDAVVFDESDMAKAPRRAKWKVDDDGKLRSTPVECRSTAAARLAAVISHVLCATGTPVADAISDLWGQLTLVAPDDWGITATKFQIRYCGAYFSQYGLVVPKQTTHVEELRHRLQWYVLQVPYRVSHGNLPAKRREVIRVPVNQLGPGPSMSREINRAAKISAMEALAVRVMAISIRKIPVLADLIIDRARVNDMHGKTVVFMGLRKSTDTLAEVVQKRAPNIQVWGSHGDHSQEEREEIRKAFLAHSGPCALIVTWQAWGTGLDLNDADTIIFGMLPVSPRDVAQGEGRGDRLSMTRPLTYIYVVAEHTVDDRVASILHEKVFATNEVLPANRLAAVDGGFTPALSGSRNIEEVHAAMVALAESDEFAREED